MSTDKTIGGESEGFKIPHTKIFYLLIVALGVAIAIVEYNAEVNPQVQANKDNIAFILQQNDKLIETDKTIQEAIVHQTNRSANNTDLIGDLEDYDKIITSEIGKINSKIKDEVQTGQPSSSEGQSTTTPELYLTLHMDKSEYVLGNTLMFSGQVVQTTQPVLVTLKLPDRSLEQVGASTASFIDGQWSANYTLRLDEPRGTWEVYAAQKADRTKVISFTVE